MIRKVGPLLIVLALSSLGCARGDWTTETLTLVDVTGTWEGPLYFGASGGFGADHITRWVLQQNGGKVRGEVQGADGTPIPFEAVLNGEMFRWELNGPLIRNSRSGVQSGWYRGEATVNGDEMTGRADGYFCPCTFLLRRVSTETNKEKKTP